MIIPANKIWLCLKLFIVIPKSEAGSKDCPFLNKKQMIQK